jgi:hypothetical protein
MTSDEYVYPEGYTNRDEARYLGGMKTKSNRVMRDMLSEVVNIVTGDRQKAYGLPEVNHGRTAAMWSAFLGIAITPRQVCLLNILQKVAREANSETRDSLVDIAGFCANAAACSKSAINET